MRKTAIALTFIEPNQMSSTTTTQATGVLLMAVRAGEMRTRAAVLRHASAASARARA